MALSSAEKSLPLALSQGDPSGIGPELTLKAWLKTHKDPDAQPFVAVADPDHLAAIALQLELKVPVKIAACAEAAQVFRHALPVHDSQHSVAGMPGVPDMRDVAGTIAAIDTCVRLIRDGEASAVITNPIAKQLFYQASFRYPGHTEYLAELAERYFGGSARAIMLIWSPQFAVIPATVHVPLARVPALLTRALLVETGVIAARDLAARFGIKNPRLAFTGINPHAGEGGSMGREEIEVIAPAIDDLAAAGVTVSGPHPADSLFRPSARKNYDAVVTMYHDQALIPIKTVAFEHAVNVTLGLPFIRTSPDHGTAFDIAGKGLADPASLIAALLLAAKLARRANQVQSQAN
ncbi:MAG: 4-hydroxythreonine-4-phosphate dehydrogenase PdxA [Beijerinckiaceae bacterium]|nr:4-hydroxythreonine-4-phosphate dehydrogenase PdxA [Beijerinckiaceae bacterium]MCI0736572.1 4-hydroxythreonine-4-phosphate dehydrogenase PdxA [Beijerinckiaceae bacterium]